VYVNSYKNKRLAVLVCLILAAVTIVAYEPVRRCGFVTIDDSDYVTNNPRVNGGISAKAVAWAFTTSHASNWHPLTWLSHIIDCELFGLNPLGHHASSLLLHIANTILLFLVFRAMTKQVWASAFIAAVFALHPTHAESVVWVAERKDVLSALFWMLTIAAYIRYSRRPSIGRYLPVFAAMLLGLMAKPMLVTLPFVLLLLDYWPLGRLSFGGKSSCGDGDSLEASEPKPRSATIGQLIAEKIPLLALAAISSGITFVVQQRAGSVIETVDVPFGLRAANAMLSYLRYIGKTIYPDALAVYYPYPRYGIVVWQWVGALLLLVLITVAVVRSHRRYLLVGWLWFVGTLVPVIGLVQVGGQAMADRYTYLPSIGLFIMAAFGAAEIFSRLRLSLAKTILVAVLIMLALTGTTRTQVGYWRDDFALCEHALAVTQNNYKVHNLYGIALAQADQVNQAVLQFRQAVQIYPRYAAGQVNLARALMMQGRSEEAIRHGLEATRIRPDWPDGYNALAMIYTAQGEHDLAIQNLRQAVNLRPGYPNAINNLAVALQNQGRIDEAIAVWQKGLEYAPGNPYLQANIATALAKQAKYTEAIGYFWSALQAQPNRPELLDKLAQAYAASGQNQQAIQTAKSAIEMARRMGKNELADDIAVRLSQYSSAQPDDQTQNN